MAATLSGYGSLLTGGVTALLLRPTVLPGSPAFASTLVGYTLGCHNLPERRRDLGWSKKRTGTHGARTKFPPLTQN